MPLPVVPTNLDALARDLANAIEGEVRFGLHDRMLYATDASLYQVEPLGVVIPADIDDAVRAVRFCAAHNLPILPRGGGTSLAGQCTNRAVVLDFSPKCRRVLNVDEHTGTCRTEPGITIDELNDALASTSWFFAPDPATSKHANIGGCIGNNAAGARSIKYGRTSENLVGVDACLADGTRVTLERGTALRDPRVRDLTRRVLDVVLPLAPRIRERFPKTIRRNAGYAFDMILNQAAAHGFEPVGFRDAILSSDQESNASDRTPRAYPDSLLGAINLAHLVCGSEGTLAVTLGAHLKLHPKPAVKGLAVVGFNSLDASIESVLPILGTSPSAVELLDDTVIDLARANTEYARYVDLMPAPRSGNLRAVLYVEFFCASRDELSLKFESLRTTLARACPTASLATHRDAKAMLNAWKLRKAGEPLLHGIPGARKPITFVEDNAVPVERLVEFVQKFRAIVAKHGTRAAYYAHASVGVLHVRPLIDIHDPQDRERMRAIAVEVADLSRSLGGVMSGEHGDGRVRGPLLERFFGPEIMAAFRQIKHLFDPHNLLNPGNIVEPRPVTAMTDNLRVEPQGRPLHFPDADTFFDYHDQHGLDHAVELCNGSGVCRKKQGGTMCPSYMATLDERHSTRGRGNALRLAITGQFSGSSPAPSGRGITPGLASVTDGASPWSDPDTLDTLHLCLSCKACKTECPSNVDIARLKAEYTAQHYREEGTPLAATLMGHIRTLNRLGSLAAPIANYLATASPIRVVVNKVLDLDPRRSLPSFSASLTSRWSATRHADPAVPTARVALFADCFTTYNESDLGLDIRHVLEAFGYHVELADVGCCARAKISLGLLPQAISEIDNTLVSLAPLIHDDAIAAILFAEPSCLSAIKDDWLALKCSTPLDTRKKLASKSYLAEDFLERHWDKHPTRPTCRELPKDTRAMLHGHCHQKALWGVETSAAALRRVIPHLEVLDTGCCGMAGSFGYTADRFDLSMKIADLSLVPAVRTAPDHSWIIAPGTSCRHQLHDAVRVQAMHPMTALARLL